MGITDIFACGMRPQQLQQMAQLEARSIESMFVILSDIMLDKPHVRFVTAGSKF
jgi:hypothetical protein